MPKKDLGKIICEIKEANATVDSGIGIPSVSTTVTGTLTEKTINFEFKNLKGDKPVKGVDYYTPAEKEQFTNDTKAIVQVEGTKVIEQIKSIVAGNPATTNALTLSGKTRVEFEQDIKETNKKIYDISSKITKLNTGYYIYSANGLDAESPNGVTTDYINIDGSFNKIEVTSVLNSEGCMIAFYDEKNNYLKDISIVGTEAINKITVNLSDIKYSKAKKFRSSGYKYTPAVYIYNGEKPYDVKEEIESYSKEANKKIYDISSKITKLNTGYYIYSANGLDAESPNGVTTDYINIDGSFNKIEVTSVLNSEGCMIAFYDEKNNYLKDISIVGTEAINKITVNLSDIKYSKAKKFRSSGYKYTPAVYIYNGEKPYDVKEEIEKINNKTSPIHYNTFSIIGDSYSTFKGYLSNSKAPSWYPASSSGMGDTNNVEKVEQTWWYKFANEYGSRMILNNSWSGSTIGYDSYGEGLEDGKTSCFINRLGEEYIGKPEMLLVFGGTNDVWASNDTGRPDFLGEYKYSDFTEADFKFFRPALAYMFSELRKKNIGMKIIFVLNTGLNKIKESVQVICKYYEISLLELSDIDKAHSHPTDSGMTAISKQLINFLNKN